MKEIVLATRNIDKIREIRAILSDIDVKILSLLDFDGIPIVVEDGKDLKDNAIKKAKIAYKYTGKIAVADDSGLEVKSLGGLPGVHSARFAGPKASYKENNQKLLDVLGDRPLEERAARFRCMIAVVDSDGEPKIFEGTVNGYIGFEERGNAGFGYDPLFIVPQYNKTFAELGEDLKNRISHRAKALSKLKEYLKTVIGD
ncbi:MAG TPA: XTP/dITP diphosphatase [bacterium (Candidatus Stahlbacteria)]|nr:XTP/dITP diphosphatase [Candidatus Stahlbacteria bacterium]